MKYIIILSLAVTLFWTGTASAQPVAAAGLLDDILGEGGEIPVKDAGVRGITGSIKEDTVIEVVKQTAMLIDMLEQAKGGKVGQSDVNSILSLFAQLAGDPDAVLFGGDLEEKWHEVFTQSHVWEEGGWLESHVETDRRAILTQQRLLQMIATRMEEFEADQAVVQQALTSVKHAGGRNALLGRLIAGVTEIVGKLDVGQAIQMAELNSASIESAHRINNEMHREAQERYFLAPTGKKITFPEFVDRGL